MRRLSAGIAVGAIAIGLSAPGAAREPLLPSALGPGTGLGVRGGLVETYTEAGSVVMDRLRAHLDVSGALGCGGEGPWTPLCFAIEVEAAGVVERHVLTTRFLRIHDVGTGLEWALRGAWWPLVRRTDAVSWQIGVVGSMWDVVYGRGEGDVSTAGVEGRLSFGEAGLALRAEGIQRGAYADLAAGDGGQFILHVWQCDVLCVDAGARWAHVGDAQEARIEVGVGDGSEAGLLRVFGARDVAAPGSTLLGVEASW